MSFANPTALFWAALAIPIVILYILKIRLRRVPVSTIIFWRQIFEEKQPRSIWQHLRHLLSLLMQLLLLCLLVLALSAPYFKWEILEARRCVLVLDNSASMNATDVFPTRLAEAKREARNLIDSLRFRDEMAIVTAGTQPQVFCGLTGHQKTLRKAIETIPVRDGPTRVVEAVELARRLLADQANRKVIVLSDGAFDGAVELAQANDVDWISIGKNTGNVAITQFQVRRSLLDALGYEILVEVANNSDEPVECRMELDLDDDVIDVVPIKLDAGDQWSKVFEKTSTSGGRLTAKIDRPDALPQDNRAWAMLPRRSPLPVILVTDGDLFLQKVFEASPLVQLSIVRDPPDQAPAGSIIVLHHKVPRQLPAGSVLVIDPTESSDFWEVGEKLENPLVTKQDKDSPLMAHVKLDNVLMPEAHKLTPKVKAHELATSLTGEPLYFTLEQPGGKLLVLTVNLDKGDLPLRTAFPIMVTNALAWFAGTKGELRESLATGAITELELAGPTGTGALITGDTSGAGDQQNHRDLLLRAPNGETRPIPSGVAKTTLGPFDQCGVWSVEFVSKPIEQGRTGRAESRREPAAQPLLEIASNLSNRRESDLRVPEGFQVKEASIATGFAGRPIWYYLVATAWFLAALEWFLYNRRWIS